MSQVFRLVSWNIEHGIKFERILRVLRDEIPADIYALQEVDVYSHRSRYKNVCAELASALDMTCTFGTAFRHFAQEGHGSDHALRGQALITQLPIVSSQTLYFPNQTRDWSLRWFHRPLIFFKIARLPIWERLILNLWDVEVGKVRPSYLLDRLIDPRDGGHTALVGEFRIGDYKLAARPRII